MKKVLVILIILALALLTSCTDVQVKTFDSNFKVVESGIKWKKYLDESTGCYYVGLGDKGIASYYKDGKVDCSDADKRIEINKTFETKDKKFFAYSQNFEIVNVSESTLKTNKINSKDAKAVKAFIKQKIDDEFDSLRKEIIKYEEKQLKMKTTIEVFEYKVKKVLLTEKIEVSN